MKYYYIFSFASLFLYPINISGQKYNLQDTLRGSITEERAWWDLYYYNLEVNVNPKSKSIFGKNTIYYKILKKNNKMQIDLQHPMKLTMATQRGKPLNITHNGNVHYITLQTPQIKNNIDSLTVYFEGTPKEALNPPWDGGFSWGKDVNGVDFIATSCEGVGASVWWPKKDRLYDEGGSMHIFFPSTTKKHTINDLRHFKDKLKQTAANIGNDAQKWHFPLKNENSEDIWQR